MPLTDYNKKKQLSVDSVSGTPQVDKAQPLILSGEGGFNVSAASFTDSFDVGSEDGLPTGVTFNDSGDKMFVPGTGKKNVYEYSLSTSFDVSTASFTDSFDVSSQDTNPQGVALSDTGDKMFVLGGGDSNVYEYSLSTSFDVSTASFTDSFDVSSQDVLPKGVAFSDTGDKMFVIGNNNDKVYEYSLSTSFDVSTASFTDSFSVQTKDVAPQGVGFNGSGDKMFVLGAENDNVYEYSLITAFDVTTASFNDSFDVSGQDTAPRGVAFSDTGVNMFVMGQGFDKVYEYSLGVSDSKTGNGDIVIDFSNVSDAQDIAVYDQNGNLLDYEIESLDTTAETGVLWAYNSWVRDGTTQAQIAYGDNSANTDRQNVTGTWGNTGQNAAMVQHLNGNATDSTSNNNDGTITGATSDSNTIFDGGYSFDGTDDNVDTTLNMNSQQQNITVAAWIEPQTLPGNNIDYTIIGSFDGDSEMSLKAPSDVPEGGDTVRFNFFPDGGAAVGSTSLNAGTKHFVGGTYDQNNGLKVFLDGSQDGSDSSTVFDSNTDDERIGERSDGFGNFDGQISEVRVYTGRAIEDSSFWQAEYDASPKAGQVFFSQQSAESVSGGGSTFTVAAAEGLGVSDNKNKFSGRVFNQVTGLGADTSSAVSKFLGEGFAVVDAFNATGPVSGTVTLNGSPVEGAVVYAFNNTQDTFVGSTTTDVNGRYAFPGVEFNGDEILVAVDHETDIERFGDAKSTVV